MVLHEEDLDEVSLVAKVHELYENKDKYINAMKSGRSANSIDIITGLIYDAVINKP